MGVYRGYGSGNSAADPTGGADKVVYDPTTSGLSADDVQAAIDEVVADNAASEAALDARLDALETAPAASGAGGLVTCNNLLAATAYSLASNSNMMMQNIPLYTSAFSFYTFTVDRLIWVPLIFARDVTLRYMMLGWYDYYDGTANITARMYIHQGDATGYGGPGTMLFDSGSFEPGVFTGASPAIQKYDAWQREITGGLAVTAGTTYWAGIVCSSAAYKISAASLNTENASFGWNKSDDNGAYKTVYKASVGTAVTAGNSPGVTLATTDKASNVPLFYFHTV